MIHQMSNFFSKGRVKIAQSRDVNKFDLSHSHITTMDFFTPRPVFCTVLKPKDSIEVDLTGFARLSPLSQPFFGDVRFVNRAFFVPFRTVQGDFNEFIENTVFQDGGLSSHPSVPTVCYSLGNNNLVELFTKRCEGANSTKQSDLCYKVAVAEGVEYDFAVSNDLYNFTFKGKQFFNILVSLGYKINFDLSDVTAMKALRLLSFCRIFHDWLKNPQYNTFDGVERIFKGSASHLGDIYIYELLDSCYRVCYSADYFTSAWDNPVAPSNALMNSFQILDDQSAHGPTVGKIATLSTNGTPAVIPEGGSSRGLSSFTDYALQLLHRATDYVKRKQLAGSRVLDRYLLDYGITLDSAKLDRSLYLGKSEIPISISDVTSTSSNIDGGSSTYTGLGDYAGRGIAAGSDNMCKYHTDEWGCLIVMSYIEPRSSYPFGRPRDLIGASRFDFFVDEFDGLGSQPIRVDELAALHTRKGSMPRSPGDIFGFAPRFSEYKTIQDNLSGDFLLQSKNASLEGWLLLRKGSIDTYTSEEAKHSLEFTEGSPFNFQNIWQYGNLVNRKDFFDHFFCRFIIRATKYSHMQNLFDYHDFESDGKQILANINGTQVTS